MPRRCCPLKTCHQLAASSVHYTTSCKQSSATVDGRNYRPKHVQLIEVINQLSLLHLVGCLYYCINDVGHTNITLLVEFCLHLIVVLAATCYSTASVLYDCSLLSRRGGNLQEKRLWILSFLRSSYISYVVLKPTTLSFSPIHLHPVYLSQFGALQPILKLCSYLYVGVENDCRYQVF